MRLESLLRPDLTLWIRDAADRDAVLLELARAATEQIPEATVADLHRALLDRESQMPTSTEEGVAFPHAMLDQIQQTVLLTALIEPPVPFRGDGEHSVSLAFCMFGSPERPWEHVRLLARLARVARAPGALDRLRTAKDQKELYERMVEEDRAHA